MASSASTSSALQMLPFDEKASVWDDILPVQQNDGSSPLCPILYDPQYSGAMNLLRALLPSNELSSRALALTEHIVKLCPSNYTVWHYRARILIDGPEGGSQGLGEKSLRLKNELKWLDDLAKQNMKTYQVWQHRKLIVSAYGDPSGELAFISRVLESDSKNYHTWAYRQWVLSHFGGLQIDSTSSQTASHPHLWDEEINYVDSFLREDCRNNSAWNHRFFCIFASGRAEAGDCAEPWKIGSNEAHCVTNEVTFAKMQIALCPNNASAWNYLRGVARINPQASIARIQGLPNTRLNAFTCGSPLAKSLVASSETAQDDPNVDADGRGCSFALEWLLDDAEERCKSMGAKDENALKEGKKYASRLSIAEPMRKRYWTYRLACLRKSATAPS